MSRRPIVAAVALVALLLAGCGVDATVVVRVERSGSGVVRAEVRLDREALAALAAGSRRVDDAVRLDDLRRAGWSARWAVAGDPPTGAVLTIEKPFTDPAGASAVVEQLAGPDGPLRELRVSRRAGAFSTRTELTATADLSRLSAGVTSDAELSKRLAAAGIDPVALERRMNEGLEPAVRLAVRVELPGTRARTWTVTPGRTARIEAGASSVEVRRVAAWAVGGLLVLGALGIGVAGELASRRRRRASGGGVTPSR